MIQNSEILDEVIDIIDLAHENGLLEEVIVTAIELALGEEADKMSRQALDEKVLNLLKDSAYKEYGL